VLIERGADHLASDTLARTSARAATAQALCRIQAQHTSGDDRR
jgi:hypothetical protein